MPPGHRRLDPFRVEVPGTVQGHRFVRPALGALPQGLRRCGPIDLLPGGFVQYHALMNAPAWQKINRATTAEALRQGAEGWTDESMALHRPWDFDPERIQSTVTWWHGDNDMNAPLSAAKRAAARLKS